MSIKPKSLNKAINDFVLITGATSGIGQATAEIFAKKGRSLILTGRRKENLLSLKRNLELKYSVYVETLCFDIRSRKQIENIIRRSHYLISNTSVLVNNAGLALGFDKFHEADLEDLETTVETNLMGMIVLTRLILPHFLEKQRGHVVNIGSVSGRWNYPSATVYCATKFAVRALSDGIRLDLFGTPIRVTNVEPGAVLTQFGEVRFKSKTKAHDYYKGWKPLRAEDIAETIAWCVDRPPHVNVQELVVFPVQQSLTGAISRISPEK